MIYVTSQKKEQYLMLLKDFKVGSIYVCLSDLEDCEYIYIILKVDEFHITIMWLDNLKICPIDLYTFKKYYKLNRLLVE